MKKSIYLSLFLLCTFFETQAQKVKYDDLYALLSTKRYEEAEPFLRTFLADDKNSDHANAHFQMAMLYEYISAQKDVLTETEGRLNLLDSALLFYQKTLSFLDDKEVRKHDDYYQAYERRDVRTGKIGIKLADVQYDIEKKIEAVKERKEHINTLLQYYKTMERHYLNAQKVYSRLRNEYPETKSLLLQQHDSVLVSLKEIKKSFDESVKYFDLYKITLGKIGGVQYDQSLVRVPIDDYKKDGTSAADFKEENIKVWDYTQWTADVSKVIKDEVIPLKAEIMSFSERLAALNKKVTVDSVSVSDLVITISTESLQNRLNSIDKKALPVAVFNYQLTELRYYSQLLDTRAYRDSLNVAYQLKVVEQRKDLTDSLAVLISSINDLNIEEEAVNYYDWAVKTYESVSVLIDYVAARAVFAKLEYEKQSRLYDSLLSRSKWLISANDSIPLFLWEDSLQHAYHPRVVAENVTAGLHLKKDRLAGYYAFIGQEMQADNKVVIDLSEAFKTDSLKTIKVLNVADESGQVNFVLFYQPEGDAYIGQVSKMYKVDGLSWTKSIRLEVEPHQLLYSNSGNLEILSQSEDGSELITTLDKKGSEVE
ncbi:hypothetical protein LVD15_16710 [Fulvivirga maritima]|uniref:hypothetical protein n=1 Tax=Fulvivirga maritima TaxID=2904247 RepID=UPI001F275702|nr:hypothetical protein [Fulvivirga maritima]UII24942.1 hypothetical protein LVD15_16710 [Fulvivirga maritima]